MMKLYGTTFYGNEASEYAKEQGYLDYRTFAKAFDAVMNNSIMEKTVEIGYWEQESGVVDNSDEINELEDKKTDLEYEMIDLDDDSSEWKRLNTQVEDIENQISDLEYEQNNQPEIFQYFIVDDDGARILQEANEILFYNEELDMYVWGVTHWGTSWDYVLTDIKLNCGEAAYED